MINFFSLVTIYPTKYIYRAYHVFLAFFGIKLANKNLKPIYNYFYYTRNKKNKRALIVYRLPIIREQLHSTWSSSDMHDMLKALSELGYKSDIVDVADNSFIPHKNYDLFIGGMMCNFKKIVAALPDKAAKIIYSGTSYWRYNNQQAQKRLADLAQRKGTMIAGERIMKKGDQEFALEQADGVILLSNDEGSATYPDFAKIFNLDVASFVDKKKIDLDQKDYDAGRNNFLFLSGSGNVHKGLDLLLDVFSKSPEKHLFICTKLQKDFVALYHKELYEFSNIHYLGNIKLYGTVFYDLVSKCNYCILPSCAEGSPGSVADCMVQGLIPLVSRESHIDIDGLGRYIEPCNTKVILELIQDISTKDVVWYKQQSKKVRQAALERFAPQIFKNKFKKFINLITSHKVIA